MTPMCVTLSLAFKCIICSSDNGDDDEKECYVILALTGGLKLADIKKIINEKKIGISQTDKLTSFKLSKLFMNFFLPLPLCGFLKKC